MAAARSALFALALLPGLAGCGAGGTGGADGPVSDSVYVEVMARLALVDSAFGPAAYVRGLSVSSDSARALVLAEWNVQGGGLVEFARDRGSEPERMQDVWDRIRELSDSLEAVGWSPGDGSTAPDSAGTGPGDDAAGGRSGR